MLSTHLSRSPAYPVLVRNPQSAIRNPYIDGGIGAV
jgi:hypothetical protein